MKDYEAHDALGLAQLVQRGELGARELLEAAIERVEKRNPALNAVVLRLFDAARAAIAAGLPSGPLAGVPFLLKDLDVQMAGTPTSQGSRWFQGRRAERDSELVQRYRRAGLVIFGKTATPELGLTTTTESRLFGVTRNPWNLERSAGGSSGGAAVAVAAGMVPAAQASDGGGSIRVPASCCGLFGLKPSRARTPAGPSKGESWSGMSCAHAITRSVRDSAALLDASAGPSAGDPYWAPPASRPYLQEIGAPPGRLRVALQLESWNGAPTHPDCRAAAEDAAQLCASLGHEVRPLRFEFPASALREACAIIICAQVKLELDARAAELGREPGAEDLEPITRAIARVAARQSSADYARALRGVHAIGRGLGEFFEDCDVLLTPTMAAPPPALGVLSLGNEDPESYQAALSASTGYTQLMNAAGVPAMSVPLFWNREQLPIGVQFAARLGGEATLFRLAAQLELARPWSQRRPPHAGA